MAMPVLIISAQKNHRDALSAVASNCGLRSLECATMETAMQVLKQQPFTAVLYESSGGGDQLCADIRQLAHLRNEKSRVIVVSTLESWDSYVAVIRAGAFDYVEFPPYPGDLERLFRAALNESAQTSNVARSRADAVGITFAREAFCGAEVYVSGA